MRGHCGGYLISVHSAIPSTAVYRLWYSDCCMLTAVWRLPCADCRPTLIPERPHGDHRLPPPNLRGCIRHFRLVGWWGVRARGKRSCAHSSIPFLYDRGSIHSYPFLSTPRPECATSSIRRRLSCRCVSAVCRQTQCSSGGIEQPKLQHRHRHIIALT